jgi:hypothetical protein
MAAWLSAMQAEGDALKRVYADPAFRRSVSAELARPPAIRLFSGEWDKLRLLEAARPDLPGGVPRLTTPALGLHGLWINGAQVADATGVIAEEKRPGRLLRNFVG